ncbi:MAG: glycoside hydrolase family 97 protein [Pyrinomonadaceae bacterium]|nr:glycoside hydrolase family 97 protein [Pyrinomonadaceae bacterium]
MPEMLKDKQRRSKNILRIAVLILFISLSSISAFAQTIQSPDGRLSLSFALTADGEPTQQLSFGGRLVLQKSKLGIELKDQPAFTKGFTIVKTDTSQKDETWEPVWGEVKQIRNHYKELVVTLQQAAHKNRSMIIRFRLFNDGLGFRYEFPEQSELKYFIVSDEKTEFNLTGDHKTFWIPGDYDTNEYTYSTTKLSEIDATRGNAAKEIAARSIIAANAVQTPLMMKTSDGLYINIHEAALVNYPAMNLMVNKETFSLSSHLVPDAVGNKAYLQATAKTPWRTIVVSDKAVDILASKLILNLSEPSKIQDVSWIKPVKYVGIWWEMHIGTGTWNYADVGNIKLSETDWASLKPNGKHGATTTNTKRYIDFAAQHGFDGVLVEGWNVGWEDWFGNWKEDVFDFVTPYPDFNVTELQQYASSKRVKLIMHHETSASVTNYERRLDQAIRFMKQHGYDSVKTGYVGRIIPRGEHHDGQWMVNHYVRVAEKMAQNRIMLDAHEPVRPTGLHRTYPNWLACEAARGNEFNAWSSGNPPEHETILPFTRLMGGPMDYTPGIFQIKLDYYQTGKKEQVHTTLAKQLALYVTMYSPLQMAADLPGNYERFMDAFQFIKDVAVDWDDTRILEAEPGDYLTIARKAKNKDEWYIGAITDEQARSVNIPLSYLAPKRSYVATLYTDAANAHWESNPMAYQIQHFLVNDQTILKIALASGGGAAISLKPASGEDMRKWKRYDNSK